MIFYTVIGFNWVGYEERRERQFLFGTVFQAAGGDRSINPITSPREQNKSKQAPAS